MRALFPKRRWRVFGVSGIMSTANKGFRQILLAIDGSFNAEAVSRYAFPLALATGGSLYLAAVITSDMGKEEIQDVHRSMARLQTAAAREGLSTTEIIRQGDAIKRLQQIVEELAIDLILVGARKAYRKRIFFVDSLSERLAKTLSCAVAVVRIVNFTRETALRRILLPVVAFSHTSEEKVLLVSLLAKSFRVPVLVYHLEEIPRKGTASIHHEVRQALLTKGLAATVPFAERLQEATLQVEQKADVGFDAVTHILAVASKHRCDLVVLGGSPRSLLEKAVTRNPVEHFMKETPVDLIVFYPSKL
ncbi:MAG: universal stress protein, partial [Nitrospira sp.]|nr:universal stress protein [Nitrospira sp.]